MDGKKVGEMEILMAAWTELNAVGKMFHGRPARWVMERLT